MELIQKALIHKFLKGFLEEFVESLNRYSVIYDDDNYSGSRGNMDLWNDLLICGTNASSRLRDKTGDLAFDANINRFYKSIELINKFEPGTLY